MSGGYIPGAGRKSSYTDELADEIVDRLANGEGLKGICQRNNMPTRMTVLNWQKVRPEFYARCARARKDTADLMDEKVMEVVDRTEIGDLSPDVAKVMLSGIMWRAAKLDPTRYGDKKDTTVNVGVGVQVAVLSEERRKSLIDKKRQATERRLGLRE